MLKKANCRWYTAETEQTELCPERLLDALMFFCIKKKLVFDAVGGKNSGRNLGRTLPSTLCSFFALKKGSRRHAGFKKYTATAPEREKTDIPLGNRHAFFHKIGDDIFTRFQKRVLFEGGSARISFG